MFFSYDYYSNNVKIISPSNSAELIWFKMTDLWLWGFLLSVDAQVISGAYPSMISSWLLKIVYKLQYKYWLLQIVYKLQYKFLRPWPHGIFFKHKGFFNLNHNPDTKQHLKQYINTAI
jgi:hypothetical protein